MAESEERRTFSLVAKRFTGEFLWAHLRAG